MPCTSSQQNQRILKQKEPKLRNHPISMSPLTKTTFMYMKTGSQVDRKKYVRILLLLSSAPYDKLFPWTQPHTDMSEWFLFRLAFLRYYDLMRDIASMANDKLLDKIIREIKQMMDNYTLTFKVRDYLINKGIKTNK